MEATSKPPPAGRLSALGLCTLALLWAIPASAQGMACGQRADIVKHLGGEYKEQPIGVGLADNGSLIEILTSKDGETWTLMFSRPDGVSCLVATGKDWHTREFKRDEGPAL